MRRVDKKNNELKRLNGPNSNGKRKNSKPGPKREFTNEQLHMIECFAKLGATNKDYAELFNVAAVTVEKWNEKKPEFYNAKMKGGKSFDAYVADAAARRATGYDHTRVEITRGPKGVTEKTTTEHVPPDTGAFIFWLTNRQPEYWKHMNTMKHEHTHKGEITHRNIQELDFSKLSEQAQELLFEIQRQQLEDGTVNN